MLSVEKPQIQSPAALTDVLKALATWFRPMMFRLSEQSEFCDIISAFNVFAFIYNVTIILNRWMTCFIAFKRCRCFFDLRYAIQVDQRSYK